MNRIEESDAKPMDRLKRERTARMMASGDPGPTRIVMITPSTTNDAIAAPGVMPGRRWPSAPPRV